jgi:hypothetical protein
MSQVHKNRQCSLQIGGEYPEWRVILAAEVPQQKGKTAMRTLLSPITYVIPPKRFSRLGSIRK